MTASAVPATTLPCDQIQLFHAVEEAGDVGHLANQPLSDLVPAQPVRAGASKEAGYRGHFARMGFNDALTDLEERRDRGATEAELIEAFPRELLQMVGYYGPAAGAAAAFRRLAEGLDVAIVRVVAARPGVESVQAVMRACAPALVPR